MGYGRGDMQTRTRRPQRRLSTHLPGRPECTARARRFVTEALEQWHCEHLADEALLLTSELVTNAVVHAGSEVDLTVMEDGGRVRVEVVDDDPRPVAPAERGILAPGGRGLCLVQALAREWGVRPGPTGKSVWFEL